MTKGRFDCVDCGEAVSFGASECAGCGTRFRYVDGRPIAEGEREPEDAESRVAPAPFRYPAAAEPRRQAFAPSRALAAALAVVLGLFASVNLLALVLQLVWEGGFLSGRALASWDEILALAAIVLTVAGAMVFLGAAMLFLFWIHDASRSARSLGVTGMRFTPRTAVFWWFVPLASLIVPYRAMAELWKVSHSRTVETWRTLDTSAVMPSWWTLWLFANLMLGISAENEMSGSPSQSAPVVAALVNVAVALLAAYVVFSIQRGLTDKARGASE